MESDYGIKQHHKILKKRLKSSRILKSYNNVGKLIALDTNTSSYLFS